MNPQVKNNNRCNQDNSSCGTTNVHTEQAYSRGNRTTSNNDFLKKLKSPPGMTWVEQLQKMKIIKDLIY